MSSSRSSILACKCIAVEYDPKFSLAAMIMKPLLSRYKCLSRGASALELACVYTEATLSCIEESKRDHTL